MKTRPSARLGEGRANQTNSVALFVCLLSHACALDNVFTKDSGPISARVERHLKQRTMTEFTKKFWRCDICERESSFRGQSPPKGWSYALSFYGVAGHCCTEEACRRVFPAWCENVGAEPPLGKCRRCSECANSPHHWLPNADLGNDQAPEELQDVDYVCKHCGAVGRECMTCGGDGEAYEGGPCGDCDGVGIIE